MLGTSRLVFDEFVNAGGAIGVGTVTVYSQMIHSDAMASMEQLGIQVVAVIPTLGTQQVIVQIEHCSDGVHFQNKNTSPELSKTSWTVTGEQAIWGGEVLPVRPTLEFVRLRITISNFVSRVKVWMAGRTRRASDERGFSLPSSPAPAPALRWFASAPFGGVAARLWPSLPDR